MRRPRSCRPGLPWRSTRRAAPAWCRRASSRGRLLEIALALLPLALAAVGPAAAEQVAVRAATHPGFGRLVFEWPSPVEVESRQSAERLTLRFARPLTADLGAVVGRLGDYLVALPPAADEREVVLQLAPEVGAKVDIHDGRIVVVDLTRAAAASAPVELRMGAHDGYARIVLDWTVPIGFATTGADRHWRIRFDREGRIDAAAIGRRFPPLVDAARMSASDGRSELELVLNAGVTPHVFALAGERVVVDLYPSAGTPPPPPGGPAAVPAGTSADSMPAAQPAAEPDETASAGAPSAPLALQMSATENGRGAVIDFAWSRPVGAAFVLRAGHLWSVFAPPADHAGVPVQLPRAAPVPGYLGPGQAVAASGGTAIRFPLLRPLAAAVEREGARWRVILAATAPPPRPAPLDRLHQPSRLRIATDEPVHLVSLIDPEVGHRLEFWPLLAPGLGQPRAQRLVDLELLATVQGLAWRAQSDRVQARILDGALELLAPEELAPSGAPVTTAPPEPESADRLKRAPSTAIVPPATTAAPHRAAPEENRRAAPPPEPAMTRSAGPEADHPPAPEPNPPPRPDPRGHAGLPRADAPVAPPSLRPLGLARFAPPDEAASSEWRAALQDRIASAPAAERPAARLELARWFLARALAAEALAVLDAVGEATAAEGGLARDSLAGAAELLMGRLDAAAAGLDAPALAADPESALWRAALAAARGDWPAGARELERSAATLEGYPPRLQLRLGLAAARIAIQAGNDDLAKLVLARLGALDLHPSEHARLAFLDGLAHAGRGEIGRADQIWRALEQGPDYATRVDAAYARVQTLLETGRLAPGDALARLTPARALWRGHPSERGMLDRLAELEQQSGDPAAAIRIWHDLLARFPAAPDVERIGRRLRDSLVGALQAEGGATIGAVQAYALYQDFPELLRGQGALDDRLRRRLAVQLAELDLIEPAAELLDELIEGRLSGPAKAEAGAALAELRLRQPDPAAALAALERSRVDDQLPPALSVQRRLLRARALAAASQPDAALALLDGRPGRSEQHLRAEILWQNRDWARFAECVEGLLARREESEVPLSAEDQELVIRLALAYARQAEPGALERLRARFAGAISGMAGEAAFLMATLTPGLPVEPEAVLALAAEHLARTRAYLDAEPASR
jgi:hypothetical protein